MCQENQDKNQEKNQDKNQEQGEDLKRGRLVLILLVVIVLAVFGAIVLFTDFLGNQFGVAAENAVLTVIAVILAALLYITNKQK